MADGKILSNRRRLAVVAIVADKTPSSKLMLVKDVTPAVRLHSKQTAATIAMDTTAEMVDAVDVISSNSRRQRQYKTGRRLRRLHVAMVLPWPSFAASTTSRATTFAQDVSFA